MAIYSILVLSTSPILLLDDPPGSLVGLLPFLRDSVHGVPQEVPIEPTEPIDGKDCGGGCGQDAPPPAPAQLHFPGQEHSEKGASCCRYDFPFMLFKPHHSNRYAIIPTASVLVHSTGGHWGVLRLMGGKEVLLALKKVMLKSGWLGSSDTLPSRSRTRPVPPVFFSSKYS